MMKKKALVVLCVALTLVAVTLAFVAYKAYGIYTDVRTQLNIIEEAATDNIELALWNVELAQDNLQKSSAEIDVYEFDYSWLDESSYVAHALGGIDSYDYTNSLEALELAYKNGFRVFEGDMQLLDGKVVLMHDEKNFCQDAGLNLEELNYESFIQAKLHGKYSPIDADTIIAFLTEHPDAWFMTDSKYTGNPYSAAVLSAFVVRAMEIDPSVLDRVILQIYNQDMLGSAMDIYPFKSVVYTLYQSADSDEQALAFCLRTGIGAITLAENRATETFVSALSAAGIRSLVHTLNEPEEIENFFDMGVSAVYTDFAIPAMLGEYK